MRNEYRIYRNGVYYTHCRTHIKAKRIKAELEAMGFTATIAMTLMDKRGEF